MFIFDAHLDLSMNAMEWNRDLREPLKIIRQREKHLSDKPDRAKNTVCFPEMHRGDIGLCVATLIARYSKPKSVLPGWASQAQAWAQVQGQLAWYKEMERQGQMKSVLTPTDLENHLTDWTHHDREFKPIGYVLSLEGADSVISPDHLEVLFGQGLMAIVLSHYGMGVHSAGTVSESKLTEIGR